MKKISILIAVIIIFTNNANSQVLFGLKGGVNLANQVRSISIPQIPSVTENREPFVGYQVGAFYKKRFHERFIDGKK